MLINRRLQIVVNIIVLVLLTVFILAGILFFFPVKGPIGTVIGKMNNTKYTLAVIISGLDAIEVARAINYNP